MEQLSKAEKGPHLLTFDSFRRRVFGRRSSGKEKVYRVKCSCGMEMESPTANMCAEIGMAHLRSVR